MCGIWGMINNAPYAKVLKKHGDFMETMLVAGSLRGEDGTGIYAVGKKERLTVFKSPVPGYYFKDTAHYRNFEYINDFYNIIVGHNRWATVGKVDYSGTHPFTEGNVTLVHNGTLKTRYDIPGFKDCDVDSQQIAYAINQEGPDIVEKLDGAFALAWYNEAEDKFYIVRNEERPLCWAMSEDHNQMYFASEPAMLQMAMMRNGIKMCPENMITDFQTGVLYTFDVQEKGVVKWTERKLTLGKSRTVIQRLTGGTGTRGNTASGTELGGNTSFLAGYKAWLVGEGDYTKKEKKLYTKFYTRKKLKEYGLKEGKTVYFYLNDFRLYPNSKVKGRLRGAAVLPGDAAVVLHNYAPEEAELITVEKGLMKGMVAGVDIASEDKDAITVKNLRILNQTEEDTYWADEYHHNWETSKDTIETTIRDNIDVPFDLEEETTEDTFIGPRGKYYTKQEFLTLVPIGCVQCSEQLDENDANHIVWDQNDQPFCSDCIEHVYNVK